MLSLFLVYQVIKLCQEQLEIKKLAKAPVALREIGAERIALNKIMLPKYLKGKILVMIDAANLESSVKDLGWWIDYIKLRNLFDGKKLVEIRNYCVHHGAKSQNNFFTFLKKNKFILITKPLKIIKQNDIEAGDIRKANFDVEIAVDAMEMVDKFDTLVLFSGDSDFNYLVENLKQKNKRIIVISSKYHVAKELIQSSSKYIDIRKLKALIKRK
ncbi:MAG: NYN domain-containing protein [bacterium]